MGAKKSGHESGKMFFCSFGHTQGRLGAVINYVVLFSGDGTRSYCTSSGRRGLKVHLGRHREQKAGLPFVDDSAWKTLLLQLCR